MTSLKLDPPFFCLRDFSGHLIGVIIVHVDDMLVATNNSRQAESRISRFFLTNMASKMSRGPTPMEECCIVESESVLYRTT